MKSNPVKIITSLFALLIAVLIAGCGGGGSSSQGTTSNSASSTTGSIAVVLDWNAISVTAKSVAAALPSGVTTLRVIVSATDMAMPIQQDFGVSSIVSNTITITGVPVGTGRTVTIKGLDASGNETHQGTCLSVTVQAGKTTAAGTVTMNSKGVSMNMEQTLSDGAQRTTIAFSALAMVTGNIGAQSFFPPGKVADYTGFQYLRDNDPDNMGHNTSFLTRVAENVIYVLNDSQFAKLSALATAQQADIEDYGAQRFPLMKAFRLLLEGTLPSGKSSLSLSAVKASSRALYLIDGQISYDRAVLYAEVLNSLTDSQKAYFAAMKGKGWKSWPDTSVDPIKSAVAAKMKSLPQGSSVAVMTYAGDLFSWYAGSIEADVYFCPERHGTYYGSFFIKDAPAIGHEGYSIDEQLTATAGRALSDSNYGYVDATQAAKMSGLVDIQRNNLYAGSTNIVGIRTQIATLLRQLLTKTDSSKSIYNQVMALSGTYGDLDGENNYNYAKVMAEVYVTLSMAQKAKLFDLRKQIMAGAYSDGTLFDFSTTATYYLYSTPIPDATAASYIGDASIFFQ
ncbi:hypothetical protein KI809_17235 [Geobacter pelophilus]|uniref:Lipoprotein n=1 Tax=Geoanaerobacter pelophilus TaxID=60036 RepID=A0AAW4L5K2_9BACT|nr:hypothetical protein [Geoanaerobacter pelophilus]MBT0666059.1 hypothetical protein [Geoanaerobacter pelophilus]